MAKAKAKPKSNRGGARPGAGRKPKAIVQLREAVLAPLLVSARPIGDDLAGKKSAAEYALALFEQTMRDDAMPLVVRLECGREVLNRTIGKPRVAEVPKGEDEVEERVHLYLPDNGRDERAGVS